MAVNQPINPESLAPPAAAYSHAVLTRAGARMLHTSGVVPRQADGSVPDDLEAQARTVWAAIDTMLHSAGMGLSDIVAVTTYAVAGQDLGVVMRVRDDVLAPHRPASTLVTVPALAQPAWKVEIAVVAAAD
ncbi:MAG TPA: RidA family protein [Acidimicrobiales bacterium]